MNEQSLFPEYPPQPQRHRSEPCCGVAHQDDPRLVMHFLHELGHSRVPFGVGALAALAGIERHTAAEAIEEAVGLGWLTEVTDEPYMDRPTGLLVGRLSRKR